MINVNPGGVAQVNIAYLVKRTFFRMSRHTRSKYTPLSYDNIFKLLAFHTFLSPQTNFKSTSSVLSLNKANMKRF